MYRARKKIENDKKRYGACAFTATGSWRSEAACKKTKKNCKVYHSRDNPYINCVKKSYKRLSPSSSSSYSKRSSSHRGGGAVIFSPSKSRFPMQSLSLTPNARHISKYKRRKTIKQKKGYKKCLALKRSGCIYRKSPRPRASPRCNWKSKDNKCYIKNMYK